MTLAPDQNSSRSRVDACLYALTIFISAFLLFQVQPIIAKMILPWFGGTSAVWTTCMLFFQTALLLGYFYAHLLHRLAARRQAIIHTVLLAASIALLPILPNPSWKPADVNNPSFLILGLLAATIGLPYLILSATSPLLQSWYAKRTDSVPYRLFALSNLASMLALLTYPILIEPYLSVRTQSYMWSLAYAAFAAACAAVAWRASRTSTVPLADSIPDEPAPGWRLRALWITLAACASTLLLAVTTFLTQDIAAIPFLWILPLSVYLLSFIICFESPRLYHRAIFFPLLVAALAGFAFFLRPGSLHIQMGKTIGLLTLALFVCCMVCHGELARLKPHAKLLTGYYVMISIGGAAGGLFVGLIAPAIFNAYYEFPIGLGICAGVAVLLLIRTGLKLLPKAALLAALLIYIAILTSITSETVRGYRTIVRNFYGELRVLDEKDYGSGDRKLLHGRINHGIQMLDPKLRRTPVAYFCTESGIGHAMRTRAAGVHWRVGILGLGAGALVPYGQSGDVFRIYEINPLVLDIARSQFTYLQDTPARVEVALGDGRLTLDREASQQFDLLVMDAFSGDSVPVHLVTLEAFQSYFRHLKPGGILAVNISNRYLDLKPVMERAATHFGKMAVVISYAPDDEDSLCNSSEWALLVDRKTPVAEPLRSATVLPPYPGFRMWTDDFSNMLSILR